MVITISKSVSNLAPGPILVWTRHTMV